MNVSGEQNSDYSLHLAWKLHCRNILPSVCVLAVLHQNFIVLVVATLSSLHRTAKNFG